MKLRAILLFLIIIYDTSLHWVEILGKEALHPLYPNFPLFGLISYNLFWVIFWTLGSIIMLTLLGSGTTVKTKNITNTHIHQDKEEIARLNKELEELKNERK